MAKIESLASVGIFTKDQRKAREFYTKRIGLVVRDAMPESGYLELGARKRGTDAGMTVWKPDPRWGADYDAGMRSIGTVTGLGFHTDSVDRTVEMFKKRRVKHEIAADEEDRYVRFQDSDGNTSFAFESSRPKTHRGGLTRLAFITIVVRDLARAEAFFTGVLGLQRVRRKGDEYTTYRVRPGGTVLMPFIPNREMYEDPADYDADVAHTGENTSIMFATRDLVELQDELMARGVRFSRKAQMEEWGGMHAKFLDPDDNVYSVIEPRPKAR